MHHLINHLKTMFFAPLDEIPIWSSRAFSKV